ncbi:MAG TPA: IclR family transcriptional regulator, partial [Planctomycetaceae bacterium]|nr:IclR family transcriptional regulator [Planctomycetaceae bacterium]
MSVPDTKRKSEAAASPSLQRGIALLEHLAR